IQPAATRHSQIADDQLDLTLEQERLGGRHVGGLDDLVPERPDQHPQGGTEALVVVDDEDRGVHYATCDRGRRHQTQAPPPARLRPPPPPPGSSMMRFTMASPRPVPSALVVKNAEKARDSASSEKPGPVSKTSMTAHRPSAKARTTPVPGSATACT